MDRVLRRLHPSWRDRGPVVRDAATSLDQSADLCLLIAAAINKVPGGGKNPLSLHCRWGRRRRGRRGGGWRRTATPRRRWWWWIQKDGGGWKKPDRIPGGGSWRRMVVVDTELIRVNFVRGVSHGRARMRSGRRKERVGGRAQPCGPTTVSGCDSCACPESDVRSLNGGSLFFSVSPPSHPRARFRRVVAQAHFGFAPLSSHQRLGAT